MDQNANSLRTLRNGLIAGYSAGMCGIIVGHPLDSIKVLLQTQNPSSSDSRTNQSTDSSGTADTAITRASKPSNASMTNHDWRAHAEQSKQTSSKLSMQQSSNMSCSQSQCGTVQQSTCTAHCQFHILHGPCTNKWVLQTCAA